ncbi:MAG: hypothetical protein WCQ67_07315 [Treponema sp.]
MLVTTYSDARKNFAAVLDRAKSEGAVIVKRVDGTLFRIQPESVSSSPFENVKAVAHLKKGSIQSALDEIRDSKK